MAPVLIGTGATLPRRARGLAPLRASSAVSRYDCPLIEQDVIGAQAQADGVRPYRGHPRQGMSVVDVAVLGGKYTCELTPLFSPSRHLFCSWLPQTAGRSGIAAAAGAGALGCIEVHRARAPFHSCRSGHRAKTFFRRRVSSQCISINRWNAASPKRPISATVSM